VAPERAAEHGLPFPANHRGSGLLRGKKEERKLLADGVHLIIPAGALYLASGKPIVTAITYSSLAAVCAYAFYFLIIVVTFTAAHGVQPDEQLNEIP
jgi:hypothetical protein